MVVYLFLALFMLHGVCIVGIMGYILVGVLFFCLYTTTFVCISCCPYGIYSYIFFLLLVMFCVPISLFSSTPSFPSSHWCVFSPCLDENFGVCVHMHFIICIHMWILKYVYLTYFIIFDVIGKDC